MNKFTICSTDEQSIEKVTARLQKVLKKGDIILSGAIPRNFSTRFVNVIIHVTLKVLRHVTHSCIYVGDGKILDIDYKILAQGTDIELVTIKEFVSRKISDFGGVTIYVVAPKNYTNKQRQMVVEESMNNFFKKRSKLTHTYMGSIQLGMRYVLFRNKKYREDLRFKNDWTCSTMVAYILKKCGVRIGKRASYTFVPPMFLFSKKFRTKSKIVMN